MCPDMLLSGCPVTISIRPETEVDLELLVSIECGKLGSASVFMATGSHFGPRFGVTMTVFRTSYGLSRHSITSTATERGESGVGMGSVTELSREYMESWESSLIEFLIDQKHNILPFTL